MVHRSANLYKGLGVISVVVALLVILLGLQFADYIRNALLVVSLFFFIIAGSYFYLSGQEGYSRVPA